MPNLLNAVFRLVNATTVHQRLVTLQQWLLWETGGRFMVLDTGEGGGMREEYAAR